MHLDRPSPFRNNVYTSLLEVFFLLSFFLYRVEQTFFVFMLRSMKELHMYIRLGGQGVDQEFKGNTLKVNKLQNPIKMSK